MSEPEGRGVARTVFSPRTHPRGDEERQRQ